MTFLLKIYINKDLKIRKPVIFCELKPSTKVKTNRTNIWINIQIQIKLTYIFFDAL